MSTMNVEERLEEQEKESIELKQTKVQVLETANIQLVEEKSKLQKNTASLEEKYQNKIVSEAENEIMVPIHQMKFLLPLETWCDLLPFVPRSQLGNLASQLGDRQFARNIQFFLHEVGQIKLGKMSIIPPRSNVAADQKLVHVMPNTTTDMPDWPMPANIKSFKEIALKYLDASVLDFLEKFQQNSLMTDVNMHFAYNKRRLFQYVNILPLVLTKIAPFITSIDSIESRRIDLLKMVYNNSHYHHYDTKHTIQLVLKEMMVKTRILVTDWKVDGNAWTWKDKMDWCCSWLYTPRSDGKPRMLRSFVDFHEPTDYASFIERIKKDFKGAKHAVSFFICAIIRRNNIEDISIDNEINEKLVIKTEVGGNRKKLMLMISRYPLKALKNWIEAHENEIAEWNPEELDRKIILAEDLCI